jgi:hypothetical protein
MSGASEDRLVDLQDRRAVLGDRKDFEGRLRAVPSVLCVGALMDPDLKFVLLYEAVAVVATVLVLTLARFL